VRRYPDCWFTNNNSNVEQHWKMVQNFIAKYFSFGLFRLLLNRKINRTGKAKQN